MSPWSKRVSASRPTNQCRPMVLLNDGEKSRLVGGQQQAQPRKNGSVPVRGCEVSFAYAELKIAGYVSEEGLDKTGCARWKFLGVDMDHRRGLYTEAWQYQCSNSYLRLAARRRMASSRPHTMTPRNGGHTPWTERRPVAMGHSNYAPWFLGGTHHLLQSSSAPVPMCPTT